MRQVCWWLTNLFARLLAPDEWEVVRGDLEETGAGGAEALREVLGLVLRRQAALWKGWRPWLALLCVTVPAGGLLGMAGRSTSDFSAIYIWLYANNWDWELVRNAAFRHDLLHFGGWILGSYLTLAGWSCAGGFLVGQAARRFDRFYAALFCILILATNLLHVPPYALRSIRLTLGRDFHNNAAAFAVTFYRVALPLIVQVCLVLLPSLWAMRLGSRSSRLKEVVT